jgi:CRP-like cAMP-binding protein
MSLMTGEQRTADAIACEETLLVVIDRDALAPLLHQHPWLEEQLSQSLAERQRRLDELRRADIEESRISVHDQVEILDRIRRFFSR